MQVYLYNVTKKRTSTKLPTGTGTSMDCNLKEPTVVLHPTMRVQYNISQFTFNYMYVPDLHRYYWITGVRSMVRDIMEFDCEIDVFATYRSQINSSTQYVSRTATRGFVDTYVTDNIYPATGEVITRNHVPTTTHPLSWKEGTYILGIIGQENVRYFAFNELGFRVFMSKLMDIDSVYDSSMDITKATLKALYNPIQYIISALWFPIDIDEVTTEESKIAINVGYFTISDLVGGAHRPIPSNKVVRFPAINFAIEKHNQARTSETQFLNNAPYSRYQLEYKPFGIIPIDASLLIDSDTLTCNMSVDTVSGKAYLNITVDGNVVSVHEAKVGVEVLITQYTQNLAGGVSQVASSGLALAGSIMTGSITGAIGATGGIANGIANMLPQMSKSGSVGSKADYYMQTPTLCGFFSQIVHTDIETLGAPCCREVLLSQLMGYTKCDSAHMEISTATATEIDLLENGMNSGFFLE